MYCRRHAQHTYYCHRHWHPPPVHVSTTGLRNHYLLTQPCICYHSTIIGHVFIGSHCSNPRYLKGFCIVRHILKPLLSGNTKYVNVQSQSYYRKRLSSLSYEIKYILNWRAPDISNSGRKVCTFRIQSAKWCLALVITRDDTDEDADVTILWGCC